MQVVDEKTLLIPDRPGNRPRRGHHATVSRQ
jgi:hypothetical protein